MPQRKLRQKKIQKALETKVTTDVEAKGMSIFEHRADQIINEKIANKHPMALLQHNQEIVDEISKLSIEEFNMNREAMLRAVSHVLNNRAMQEAKELPIRHLFGAIKIVNDELRSIHGEPTQRIEVKKTVMTPSEYERLFKTLPKDITHEAQTD